MVGWAPQPVSRSNTALFADDWSRLEIVSWSTDWSPYFDAGHEWWGAFLWTVYVPAREWIVVVAASATD